MDFYILKMRKIIICKYGIQLFITNLLQCNQKAGLIYYLLQICRLQVCGVEFDRKDIMMNKLVATTLESKFHVFDVRTQHPEKGFASLSEKVCVINFTVQWSLLTITS